MTAVLRQCLVQIDLKLLPVFKHDAFHPALLSSRHIVPVIVDKKALFGQQTVLLEECSINSCCRLYHIDITGEYTAVHMRDKVQSVTIGSHHML